MLLTTFILLLIWPNNAAEQGIPEVKSPATTYAFQTENLLFYIRPFPFPIQESPEPKVQAETLPSKEVAETFGSSSASDEIEYTDGEILDWLIMRFKEDYFVIKEIIRCESRWQVDKISPTGDVGLAQINLKEHWNEIPGETREEKIAWLQNPFNNIDFAYTLHLANGWNDWGTPYTDWGSYYCWSNKIN